MGHFFNPNCHCILRGGEGDRKLCDGFHRSLQSTTSRADCCAGEQIMPYQWKPEERAAVVQKKKQTQKGEETEDAPITKPEVEFLL